MISFQIKPSAILLVSTAPSPCPRAGPLSSAEPQPWWCMLSHIASCARPHAAHRLDMPAINSKKKKDCFMMFWIAKDYRLSIFVHVTTQNIGFMNQLHNLCFAFTCMKWWYAFQSASFRKKSTEPTITVVAAGRDLWNWPKFCTHFLFQLDWLHLKFSYQDTTGHQQEPCLPK